jgi:hypothetical protein
MLSWSIVPRIPQLTERFYPCVRHMPDSPPTRKLSKFMECGGSHTEVRRLAGGEDPRLDGAGFLPHLASVLSGGYVPQIYGGVLKDRGEACGGRGLLQG